MFHMKQRESTMAMSDEEREKLKGLSPEDLVEMFAAMRDERDKLDAKYREERKRLISSAMSTREQGEIEGEADEDEVLDLRKNAAFQRLKKKTF